MASNQVNINLSLQDQAGSIKQRTDEVKILNQQLEKSKQLATGTKTGNKAVAASFGGSMGNAEYTTTRGIVGTGASGRDFSKQAQGLDGLVRLYATYAANLFAVTAAFSALSNAMDTTNMVQGLNQLGAQSGLALGTLAKNFSAATGGAISLREAMESTAKATSAGLSSKQLMQLGTVANSASKALGVNMSDAVSRLTRGITKLEPELLDELGIFTKVGKATEDYALSVGKSVSSLTDFEKRQAYANAVLKEGADKFGAINIDANPYDKLTASLKDLAQNGLEKLNKLLVPLVSALSSSPVALTAGIIALSSAIIKQAIPAIGEYRASLADASSRAAEASKYRAEEATKAAKAQAHAREDVLDKAAEVEKKKVAEASKALSEARDSGFGKGSKAFKILQKDAADVTKEEMGYLKKLEDQYRNQGKITVADRYKDAQGAIQGSVKAEGAYATKVAATNKELDGKATLLTHLGRTQIIAQRAQDIATSKSITSTAAERTQILGMSTAWSEMRKSVKESDMGPIRKGFTTLASGISIATTAAMGLINAFQTYFFIAASVVAAFKLFDAWVSKNTEQTLKFNSAIETSNEAVKTYNDTMSALLKKDPASMFTAESLTAKSNAILGLVDSLTTLREAFSDLNKATSGWDSLTNWVSKFWGGDKETKFAESAAANITKQISAMTDEASRMDMTSKVNTTLGTTGSQFNWIEALKKNGPEASNLIKQLEGDFKKLGQEAAITASRSTEFNDSLVKVQTSYKAFAFSSVDKSPISKLGDDMLSVSVKMAGALVDPLAGLTSMKKLLAESTTLGIFDPKTIAQLVALKTKIDSLSKAEGNVTQELIKARQELDAIQLAYDTVVAKQADYTKIGQSDAQTNARVGDEGKKLADKLVEIIKLNKKDADTRLQIAELMKDPTFAKLTVEAFKTGSTLLLQGIKNGFAQATLDLQKGILSTISGIPGTAALDYKVSTEETGIQRQLIKTQQDMMRAQYLQIAATIANTAALEMTRTSGTNMDPRDLRLRSLDPKAEEDRARAIDRSSMSGKFSALMASPSTKNSQQFIKDVNVSMEKFGAKSPEYATELKSMVDSSSAFLGTQVELAKLDTKDKLTKLTRERALVEEQKAMEISMLSIRRSDLELQTQKLSLLASQNGFLSVEQLREQHSYQDKSASLEREQSSLEIIAERAKIELSMQAARKAGLDTTEIADATDKLIIAKSTLASNIYSGKIEQNAVNTKLAINKQLADEETRRLNIKSIIQETNNIGASNAIELSKMELDYQIKNLSLTDQQIADKKYMIEQTVIQADQISKLAAIDIKYLNDKNALELKLKNTVAGEAGNTARAQINEELAALANKKVVEITGIKDISEAKRQAAAQDATYSERQKAYGAVFEDTFKGMADALIEFTKTGKLNFKGLVDSMIEGLIRYELQQQQIAMYAAAKPGIMNFFGSLFGGARPGIATSPITTSITGDIGTIPSLSNLFAAKGNIFDAGLKTFAQGGMFTNSVVNQPTLFKFAQGTGLMGEAGPEAIMPLKRDSNGNLGVRSGNSGTSVDVVVNNYGNEKATTKETMDSRGNRKIEVTVGDMVAGELSRPGSAVQQSLAGNFNSRPAVARR